jgi:hypothetical protein
MPNGVGPVPGIGGQGQGSRLPPSSSGQMRERPSDGRLSVHRSEGNLASDGPSPNGSLVAGSVPIPHQQQQSGFRIPPPPQSSSSHTSSGPNSANPNNTYTQHPHPQSANARPTSYIPSNHGSVSGSQQSLSLNMAGVNAQPGSQHWRGPFQGQSGGNGSRNSSRGSAPNSPGPDDRPGRTSIQLDSDGRRTPVSQDHR